eukprot:5703244-Ditylum_brightwellii.AAC.2
MCDMASHDSIIVVAADANVKLGQDLTLDMEGTGLQNSWITGPFSTHKTSDPRDIEAAHTLAAHLLTSAATWFRKRNYSTFQSTLKNKEELQLDHFFIQENISVL